MYYLYGAKAGGAKTLVATFDSKEQLLAYVRWATLSEKKGVYKFEQGSSLASYQDWSFANELLPSHRAADVPHNPTPGML